MNEIFKKIVQDALIKAGISEPTLSIRTLSIPTFWPKVLFQKRDLVLGRIMNIVGEEASFKTTFSLELARWFIESDGWVVMLHTEGRFNEELVKGILGNKLDAFQFINCDSLEQWQKSLFTLTRGLKQEGVDKPVLFIIDSIMGSNLETTRKTIEEDGFASARYPAEARSIADFLRSYSSLIDGTSYFLCFINHRKYRMPMQGYMPVKSALGGSEVRFYTCYDLDLRKSINKIKLAKETIIDVTMRLDKNTYGPPNVEIQVPVHLIKDEGELRVYWGWDEAAAKFLTEGAGVKPPPSQAIMKELQKLLCLYHRTTPRGEFFWSEKLGVSQDKAVPAEEIMRLIYAQPELMEAIYNILSL